MLCPSASEHGWGSSSSGALLSSVLLCALGTDSTTTPRDGKQLPVHVWKGRSVSQMPGTEMAGDNLVPGMFQGGLTLPQRSMKPAREVILLRKPSHFSPAIWSVKQGMGNGWVIPKEHQPSSQTYFSNALHFNVQVGIPAKTFLGSCSSIPGTWQRDTQWCWKCSGVPQAMWKAWKKCSKCKAKIKYFWPWWSILTFVKCLSTTALFITTSSSPADAFELRTGCDSHFICSASQTSILLPTAPVRKLNSSISHSTHSVWDSLLILNQPWYLGLGF